MRDYQSTIDVGIFLKIFFSFIQKDITLNACDCCDVCAKLCMCGKCKL